MDVVSQLDFVPSAIPSETRTFVFLASGRNSELETKWLECGGTTIFIFELADVEKCGICIFRRGMGDADVIESFFKRGGKEANVFYFCPFAKKFFRVDLEWLKVYSSLSSV